MAKLHIHFYPDPYESNTVFTIEEGGKVIWVGPQLTNGNKLTGPGGNMERRSVGADRFVKELRRQVKFGCDYYKVEADLGSAAWSHWAETTNHEAGAKS
jgi:hypothetical protein